MSLVKEKRDLAVPPLINVRKFNTTLNRRKGDIAALPKKVLAKKKDRFHKDTFYSDLASGEFDSQAFGNFKVGLDDKALSMMERLVSIFERGKDNISEVSSELSEGGLAGICQQVARAFLGETYEMIRTAFVNNQGMLLRIFIRISVVLILIYVLATSRFNGKAKILFFGTVGAVMFLMGDSEFKDLLEMITGGDEDRLVAQSTEDELGEALGVIGPLVHLVFVSILTGKAKPGDNWSKYTIEAMTNIHRTADPFRNIIGVIKEVCRYTCDKFMVHVLGKKPFRIFSGLLPKAAAWVDEANQIVTDDVLFKFPYNMDNLVMVMVKQLDGMILCEELFMSGDKAQIMMLRNLINKLYAIQLKMEADGVVIAASRVEATILGFFGGSGVGKTYMMKPIMCCVLAKTLTGEKLKRFLANKNEPFHSRFEEVEFWDGYKGQVVCMMDDFGQNMPAPGKSNDYLTLIRAGNMFEWQLHMASLAAKTNRFFTSHYLVLSSNVTDVEFEARKYIMCAEAAERRIDINCIVTVKPKYCKPGTYVEGGNISDRRLDKSKVKTGFDKDIYEFHIRERTYKNGNLHKMVVIKVIDFDEMVETIIRVRKVKQERFDGVEADMDNMIKNIVDSRLDVGPDCKFENEVVFDQHFESQGSYLSLPDYRELLLPSVYLSNFHWEDAFVVRASCMVTGCNPINVTERMSARIKLLRHEFENVVAYDRNGARPSFITFDELVLFLLPILGSVEMDSGVDRLDRIMKCVIDKVFDESNFELSEESKSLLGNIDFHDFGLEDIREEPELYSVDKLFDGRLDIDSNSDMMFCFVTDIFSVVFPKDSFAGVDMHGDTYAAYVTSISSIVRDVANCLNKHNDKWKHNLSGYLCQIDSSNIANRIDAFKAKHSTYFMVANISMKVCGAFTAGVLIGKVALRLFKSQVKEVMKPTLDELKDRIIGDKTLVYSKYVNNLNPCVCNDFALNESEVEPIANGRQEHNDIIKMFTGKDPSFVAQGYDDLMETIMEKVVGKNLYAVLSGNLLICFAFFLFDNTLVIPMHCVERLIALNEKGFDTTLCHPISVVVKYTISRKELLSFEQIGEADISIGVLGGIRKHANLTEYLIDRQTFGIRSKGVLCMPAFKESRTSKGISRYTLTMPFSIRSEHCYTDQHGKKWTNMFSLEYVGLTVNGDCGLPLFIMDPTTRCSKLIGFHVAGSSSSNLGVGAFLWKSYFKTRPMDFVAQSGEFETFKLFSTLDRSPGTSSKSRIVKSKLYETWGPSFKKPAHLTKFKVGGNMIDPWEIAFRKYDVPKPIFDVNIKLLVSKCFSMVVNSNIQCNDYRRVLSVREAICGIPGDPGFPPINRTTSLGYPDNLTIDIRFPGKTRYLGFSQLYDLDSPAFKVFEDRLHLVEEILKKERFDCFYYTGMLKDETLPIAKVDLGKTRYVSGASFLYTVLFNMYFGGFKAMMYHSRLHSYSAIGINPYSSDWDVMVKKMLTIGKCFLAGDHKWFDVLQIPGFYEDLVEFLIKFLRADSDPDWVDRIRRNLWYEVYKSRHIFFGKVYEWDGSLPSGNPGTAYLNTLYNMFLLLFCWTKIVIENSDFDLSIDDFSKHVCAYCFGDDLWATLSNLIKETFNQISIQELFKKYGMDFTNESKTDNVEPYRKYDEVTFLKRGIRFEPLLGRYVAPLDLKVILEFPYWSHKGPAVHSIPKTNVELALRELSLHGDDIFDKYSIILTKSLFENYGEYIPVMHRLYYLEETCCMSPRDRGRPYAQSEIDFIEL